VTTCYCGGLYRCETCRLCVCHCQCRFEEPTDAKLAGHGINTEVSDPVGANR